MKKVMILTATVLAFGFATPQVSKAMKVQNDIEVIQEKEVTYQEIKVEEIPEAVSKAISSAYVGYKIDKAFLGDDATFKIKVSMGELRYDLFYKINGELIKVEEPVKK